MFSQRSTINPTCLQLSYVEVDVNGVLVLLSWAARHVLKREMAGFPAGASLNFKCEVLSTFFVFQNVHLLLIQG